MAAPITQKDTTFTKIFVGGLPYHTTDQSLREFFEQFGDIEEAVVITDRQTGKSRGYGFVTMSDRAAAERACKDPNPIIDGRKANVNLAYLGAKPRLQAGEAAFPFALKAGLPGVAVAGQFGLPGQYLYAPSYVTPSAITMPVAPTSPLSPSAAAAAAAASSQSFLEYASATAGYPAAQLPAAAGFDAYNPYAGTTAAAYVTPTATGGYTYAMPQPTTLGALAAAHYQTQQIPERMQ